MFKNKVLSFKKFAADNWLRKYGIDREMDALKPYLDTAANELEITIPGIRFVPYMVDYAGKFMLVDRPCQELVNGDPALGKFWHENMILVGVFDPTSHEALGDAEILMICLHEMRHVYQKQHAPELYGSVNTWGSEVVFDISEIDADAWALAYMRTHTSYSPTEYLDLWLPVLLMDGGKRLGMAMKYEKEMTS